MSKEILFLKGVLKERIWGSHYFRDVLKKTNDDTLYGELWTLSAHPEGLSVITSEPFVGQTLNEVFKNNKELFSNTTLNEFPILIKIIASSGDLSIQVHPKDEYARKYENQLGKTESWLILDNEPHAKIVVGHYAKDINDWYNAINRNDFESILKYEEVSKGMFVKIPAGTVHALGKGVVLLEVQQSSDVTYRLYDYNRVDKNGNKRALHIEKGLANISYDEIPFDKTNYFTTNKEIVPLWNNRYFDIKLVNINDEYDLININHDYYLITVIEGNLEVNSEVLKMSDSFIVTSISENVKLRGNCKIVITKAK